MARISAEARGASVYRAGGKLPQAPANFSKEAADIWREVVSAKPVDWFDGGSLRLLRQFCRTMAQAERIAVELDAPEARMLSAVDIEVRERRLVALNGNCTTLATKLRITVQLAIGTKSGMITEGTDGSAEDELLGGKAVWSGRRLRAVN